LALNTGVDKAAPPRMPDNIERLVDEQRRMSRFGPNLTEIWSAKPLNSLLADARKIASPINDAATPPISDDILAKINITSGKGISDLQQHDATADSTGKYKLKGSAADIVRYMGDNGLQFAPATKGSEAAYSALYNALRNYVEQYSRTRRE
jgi:hypothetical protein